MGPPILLLIFESWPSFLQDITKNPLPGQSCNVRRKKKVICGRFYINPKKEEKNLKNHGAFDISAGNVASQKAIKECIWFMGSLILKGKLSKLKFMPKG